MKDKYHITTVKAAEMVGCSPGTAWRRCRDHDIGILRGKLRYLCEADVEQLREVYQGGPGNPNFTPGNHFGVPPEQQPETSSKG